MGLMAGRTQEPARFGVAGVVAGLLVLLLVCGRWTLSRVTSMDLGWLGEPRVLVALALLVLGSSCFKPALTAWLGSLYAADDAGQSAGFAWFYFAANIGAAAAPFVGGALRTRHGWPACSAPAGRTSSAPTAGWCCVPSCLGNQ